MSLPYAPPPPRHGPQAAFLAQLLSAAPAGQPQAIRPETPAHSAYRSAEASDQRRMPNGFRKMHSA